MICAKHERPCAVLTSVHGWNVQFWVNCDNGALRIGELTEMILDGFAKQVPVWLPRESVPILRWSGRVIDPTLRVADAIPNQAQVVVHI